MIVQILVAILVIAVVLWLINTYIPMDAKIKQLVCAVVAILFIIWLLRMTGVFSF